jgi:hypothetical protein
MAALVVGLAVLTHQPRLSMTRFAYIGRFFYSLNSRIKTQIICDEYLPLFGDKYVGQFKKKVDAAAAAHLANHRRDIRSAYSNLIIWRNDFAHDGKVNTTATYAEVVLAYEDGKEIIRCLAEAMVR